MTNASPPSPTLPAAAPEAPHLARPPHVPAWVGLALCLLLAVAQVALGSYQLGMGNQAIQIAFLKHWAYPWMYSSDVMVRETMPAYPSFFFRALAPLLAWTTVESLYLAAQIITSFLTLAAVYVLGRNIFRSHATALAGAILLVPGHLHALAGDTLYSTGFTHTFAALPLALAALALAYRGRWALACVLAGVLFNIHALTAAYAMLMIAAAMFADFSEQRLLDWLSRGFLAACAFVACASPTLGLMLTHQQTFDDAWINLTRIRSADHSFPTTWWAAGDTDVPRFVLLLALFVLSWSFAPLRRAAGLHWGGASRAQRITILMTAAVLALFAGGYYFTEIHPLALVIRLQPFRASRLLLVLMLVHIAHAAICALRAGLARPAAGAPAGLSPAARVAEVVFGICLLATLLIPPLLTLLPVSVLAAMLAALVAGHLSWRQAILATLALLVALLATLQNQFPMPGLTPVSFSAPALSGTMAAIAVTAGLLAAVCALLAALRRPAWGRTVAVALALAAGVSLARVLFLQESRESTAQASALAGVTQWARQQTGAGAVFLVPAGMSNFRIDAERAIVGEWRDGTQLYFSASFGPEWLDRVENVEPGLTLSSDGKRLISRGAPLQSLDDASLVDLASRYQARYILLPADASRTRRLLVAYADSNFVVYEPQIQEIPVPVGVTNAEQWNQAEEFMSGTVAANIEKYRKADLTLQIVDRDGRPVSDLPVKLDQTNSPFVFGISLGFFKPEIFPANLPSDGDMRPPPARPVELQKAPEVFNGSMIPFSSKWLYLEPVKGKPNYADLDAYVDYCTRNNMAMEFHHLSGTLPQWVISMGGVGGQRGTSFSAPRADLQTEFNRHCFDTVARYADRVKYWQVVNEEYMMQYVPPVLKALKEKYPDNQFGLSDCVRFWDGSGPGKRLTQPGATPAARDTTQFKGVEAIDYLLSRGAKPDFFSVHGHYPLGLWADPREMYRVFDYFQERNIRVHITEEYLQIGGPIYGPLRTGTWTPDLQAEYLARFLTVAFSHPDVDLVNLWGMPVSGWGASNSGLLDAADKPRPAFDTLKKLFTQTWRTHAATTLSFGTLTTRAFHGTYTLSLTLPNGHTATTTLTVPQQPAATIRLVLDNETLKPAPTTASGELR